MNRESLPIIEAGSAELADQLLIECCCCLGRPDRIEDILRTVQAIEGSHQISGLVELEAVAHAGERAGRGKLRDGVTILAPEFVRALLTKVDAFPPETKSDSSPRLVAGGRTAVAGKPDRAAVAREPKVVATPSATPVLSRPRYSHPI